MKISSQIPFFDDDFAEIRAIFFPPHFAAEASRFRTFPKSVTFSVPISVAFSVAISVAFSVEVFVGGFLVAASLAIRNYGIFQKS